MGAKLKRNISEIFNPAADEIPTRRTFVSYARHLMATYDLIADLWCIVLKISQAMIGATSQRKVKLYILPLTRRYRYDKVFSMIRLNAHFLTDTLFSDVKSLNHNKSAKVFSHKAGFNATYPMVL